MKKFFSLFKNKKFVKRFIIGVAIVFLILAYIFYEKFQGRIFIDDSLIQAPIITISPSTSGKVQEVDVTEGQRVQKGDTLAVVGSETLRANTDGLVITASDLTGSSVNPQTQLIQMIQPVDLR